MFNSNDRYYRTKGFNPHYAFRPFKPRTLTGTAQVEKHSLHRTHVSPVGSLSRSRVSDYLQAGSQIIRHRPPPYRPRCTHCTVHATQSRDASDDTPVIRRSVHVWTNKRDRDTGSFISVRDSICVPAKDFSPVLLDNTMIKYLVLGPGSTGLFAMLGCIQMLHDTEKMDIKEISGASSGAILALLYIISGGDIHKILTETLDTDIESNTKVNIKTLFKKYGFIDTCGIKKKLGEVCYKFGKLRDPTFSELYDKFPIKLHISAYCLENGKTDYFSSDSHPGMKVLDAIGGSIAVPFLFCSQQIDGKTYIDGGMAESIPLIPFLSKHGDDVCCIKVAVKDGTVDTVTDIKSFTQQLIYTMLKYRITYENARILSIDLTDFDIFDFKITDKQKMELFVKGYLAH